MNKLITIVCSIMCTAAANMVFAEGLSTKEAEKANAAKEVEKANAEKEAEEIDKEMKETQDEMEKAYKKAVKEAEKDDKDDKNKQKSSVQSAAPVTAIKSDRIIRVAPTLSLKAGETNVRPVVRSNQPHIRDKRDR